MAIQAAYSTKNGDYSQAYHRVVALHLDARLKNGYVSYVVYINAAARVANKEPIDATRSFPVTAALYDKYFAPGVLDDLGVNWMKQAYAYMKTLPAYKDAVDV